MNYIKTNYYVKVDINIVEIDENLKLFYVYYGMDTNFKVNVSKNEHVY